MIRYGIEFPDGTSEASIELHCYRWGIASAGEDYRPIPSTAKWEHLYRAIKLLWPERMPSGRRGYIESAWTIPRVKAWCDLGQPGMSHDIWWGPSSTGKTTDAAVIVLADWLAAPDKTSTNVVSTSVDMLKLRIFGEIARFYQMHEGMLPGEYKASKPCIVLGDDNSKNGIFGHAVHKGNVDTSINNLIGLHNEFNRLVIDEMQGSLPAASTAATNLASGREFKFLGMGNPQSRLDPMGRHSEPITEKGLPDWSLATPARTEWRTKYGTVHFFDGLKSPGIADPSRYFFMLSQKMIDETKRIHGENSVEFWSQRRGFMPPEGLLAVVMSETFIIKFHMQEPAVWKYGWRMAAGLDLAYSAGGDRCMFYPFKYGVMSNDVMGIEYQAPVRIELGSVGEELMAYHICNQVRTECEKHGITPEDLAADATGAQGATIDVMEREWGRGILRVEFGGKPSERALETNTDQTAKTRYKNKVTELWYSMNYFGRNGHIRGLSDKACLEFSQRRIAELNTPMRIESKKDMKERTAESPDESDSAVIGLEWMRVRQGFLPGTEAETPEKIEAENQDFRNFDVDADSMVYLSFGA